jgi:NAD(P)-dependent dehydrogenase (short-subunit alcohol dehydrogenase family)
MVPDSFMLDGSVALVTGASGGIGHDAALALAAVGADVALLGHSQHPTKTRDKRHGLRTPVHQLLRRLERPRVPDRCCCCDARTLGTDRHTRE